jgi:3-deoxy-D-manno-octulosonate 8-phosphate phosphatase (KDO 8-P phosphatase)
MNKDKLKNIKAVVFDVDGVLFTGRAFVHPESGEMLKERSHIDGQGVSLLRAAGIQIAFVTGEKTGFLTVICNKLNSLPSVESGKWEKVGCFLGVQGEDKVKTIDEWLKSKNISWQETAAMGDDLADLQMLKKSAFAAAPAQAEKVIKNIADYVAEREGGNGAIRDFCNLILEAKGIDPATLALR